MPISSRLGVERDVTSIGVASMLATHMTSDMRGSMPLPMLILATDLAHAAAMASRCGMSALSQRAGQLAKYTMASSCQPGFAPSSSLATVRFLRKGGEQGGTRMAWSLSEDMPDCYDRMTVWDIAFHMALQGSWKLLVTDSYVQTAAPVYDHYDGYDGGYNY